MKKKHMGRSGQALNYFASHNFYAKLLAKTKYTDLEFPTK